MKITHSLLIYIFTLCSILYTNSLKTGEQTMSNPNNPMKKFEFLIGTWNLEYRVPKSQFSEPDSGTGTGTFQRALNDKYVYFDYESFLTGGQGKAHAIFAWDDKVQIYRFWWFEDSGSFQMATCHFINDETLFLSWHETSLIQTFTKVESDKVILRMEHPVAQDKFELILEVILSRK
jgi:hypothetical protein